jgi:hypothetical protein
LTAAFSVQAYGQIVTAQEFSGRATGISSAITTNGTTTTATTGDTCPLPARGGTSTVTTSGPLIQGILGSGTIVSSTSGSGITSQSSSSVSNFTLVAGGYQIAATNISASTQCNCCDISNPGCSGESTVTGFTVTDPAGVTTTITPNGSQNQVVNLPVGTITFNERTSAPGELTVTGAHINVTIGGTNYNVQVATAKSDIVCPGIVITAGEVSISGHLVDSNGSPIGRASVWISNTQGSVVRTTTSDDSGAYTLTGITSGATYIVNASSRGFTFTPRSISLLQDVTGFNLIGSPR